MGDDELEEARRRWGGHVEAVYSFPDVPEGAQCPFLFGDVVHIRGGRVGLLRVPDQGGGRCEILELEGSPSEYSFPDTPKPVMTTWSNILRAVASYKELPEHIKSALAPYRKCIVLGGMHWDMGVEFMDSQEQELLRSGQWSEFNIGSKQLVDEFFGAYSEKEAGADADTYRVLVHAGDNWNNWVCFGPMTEEEADELIGGLPGRYQRPREVRRGVYEVGPETMTKWELYRGYTKIREAHICRGQGE